jgi:hypothetical protein
LKLKLQATFETDDGLEVTTTRETVAPMTYLSLHDDVGEFVLSVIGATTVRDGKLCLTGPEPAYERRAREEEA